MRKILKVFLCLIIVTVSLVSMVSCGNDGSVYAKERDVEGRDIHYVEISVKDYGKITVLLDATTAPITVENFLKLVNEGFYNGLTFHRVMNEFMIQGGCPLGNGTGSSDEKIKGEFSSNGHKNDISHLRGTISMARATPYNSGSCQFFICNSDSVFLDGDYAAFGYVVKGMKVVDKITEETVVYADPQSGTILQKNLQAVIEYIKEI